MNNKIVGFILTLLVFSSCLIYADSNPGYSIDQEFVDCPLGAAPLGIWESAGSNAVIDPLTIREIDITHIQPIVCLNLDTAQVDTTYFEDANPGDDMDDSLFFQTLLNFLALRKLNILEHIRINIPSGIYNFSDQIVMHSNISLKGAGST